MCLDHRRHDDDWALLRLGCPRRAAEEHVARHRGDHGNASRRRKLRKPAQALGWLARADEVLARVPALARAGLNLAVRARKR